MNTPRTAMILFSGGQDSAICLAWALSQYERVYTVGFEYGQRHDVEMRCRLVVRKKLADMNLGAQLCDDEVLNLTALGQISETALTRAQKIAFDGNGMPNTFVPGRNLIFLNYAAALAYRLGITDLVGGMCEADYSGYPDCRQETLDATMTSISLGMGRTFVLHTPLMHLNKGETWTRAHSIGGDELVAVINEHSHTCYLGNREERHAWGYGCATCPACELRAQGWAEYSTQTAWL